MNWTLLTEGGKLFFASFYQGDTHHQGLSKRSLHYYQV